MSETSTEVVSLFRREALNSSARANDGQPFAPLGVSTSLLCALALTLAGALIGFAFSTETTRSARVHGYLEPSAGLIKVRAPGAGRIARMEVSEGALVRRGQLLLLIDADQASESGAGARAAVLERLLSRHARLNDELDAQKRIDRLAGLERARAAGALEAAIGQLGREMELQLRRVENAASSARRQQRLAKRGHLPAAAAEAAEAARLDARARAEEVKREHMRTERELAAMRAEAEQATLGDINGRSRLLRERDALAQDIAAQRAGMSVRVEAPIDGIVSGLLLREGERVPREAPLMTLIPAGTALEARLLLPSHAAGFVAPGQAVSLRYAAFPYQRFGAAHGEVTEVASTLLLPGEKSLPVPLDAPAYVVRVALAAQDVSAYGRQLPLKAGMQLDADIALDRRRVVEWLFEPLLGLRGRLHASVGAAS